MEFNIPSPLQQIEITESLRAGVDLWLKRDDLIHPMISGNKWRKLKYNIHLAKKEGYKKILTFGGAYSNHIAAVGAMAAYFDLEFHAFIRGEELSINSNPTLEKASKNGLNIHFIDRGAYREYKRKSLAIEIGDRWKDYYLIPEGGLNEAGVVGCEEIMDELDLDFDYICLAAGTGTTAAGILRRSGSAEVIVFPALKGAEFLKNEILGFQRNPIDKSLKLQLNNDYHFGGYAKHSIELIQFTRNINERYNLPLDYVYTAKAFFGLLELLKENYFRVGSKVLFYHSGGLQANYTIDQKY